MNNACNVKIGDWSPIISEMLKVKWGNIRSDYIYTRNIMFTCYNHYPVKTFPYSVCIGFYLH